jgi:uncharacterized delta-60 repeat protein
MLYRLKGMICAIHFPWKGVVMHNRYLLIIGIWVLFVFAGVFPAQAVSRLDTSFGLNGRVAVELGVKNSAHAVVVQPDGKIVVAGSSSKGTALNFSLLRFNKDGSLDTTFNEDGSIQTSVSIGDDEALALALLSDGRIVAAGYSHNGVDRDFAMVCYREDGSLDQNFGKGGVVVTPIGSDNEEITAITTNSYGLITVVGATEGTTGKVLVAARYFADGELDRSFGELGVSIFGVGEDATAEGVLERADGSYVVSGSYEEKGNISLMLVGLTVDGLLASRFGEQGVAVPSGSLTGSEGFGVAEDSDGLIYVAGSVGIVGRRDAALFRFTMDGTPDTLFGDQGMVVNRASEEDDVLYAVTVGRNGMFASGYTTGGGIRKFLLASYAASDMVTVLTATSKAPAVRKWHVESETEDIAPIQDVWENGDTKVQVRHLLISPSLSDYLTVRSGASPSISARVPDPQRGERTLLSRMLASVFKHASHFLLPSAMAADGNGASSVADAAISPQFITVAFSEGESVGYAVTTDEEGNVIVVGTAINTAASSMVAARYVAETATGGSDPAQDEIANGFIITTQPNDITKTTVDTGGQVAEDFGRTVAQRGVVFSIDDNPEYTDNSDELGTSASIHAPADGLDVTKRSGFSPVTTDPPLDPISSAPSEITFVEKGKRESGSGYGSFSTHLQGLKPGTIYHVRAYAVADDGEVYYGNQVRFRTADACFVATASFGTLLHPAVRLLRDFRDTFMVHSVIGHRFVDLYYAVSPPVADCIAQSGVLRFIVRLLLLPFIGFSWLALQMGMGATLLTLSGTMLIISMMLTNGSYFRFLVRR